MMLRQEKKKKTISCNPREYVSFEIELLSMIEEEVDLAGSCDDGDDEAGDVCVGFGEWRRILDWKCLLLWKLWKLW